MKDINHNNDKNVYLGYYCTQKLFEWNQRNIYEPDGYKCTLY